MSRTLTPAIGIALTLFLTLVFTFSQSGQVYAQAEPVAPDAPGSIAGVVINTDGEALAGIEVQLFRLNYGSYEWMLTLTTDANGAYRAAVLPAGSYRLLFRDPTNGYVQTYYANAPSLELATTITVVGNNVTGIDATLTRAGVIQGAISYVDGDYRGYPEVAALTRIDGVWRRAASVWIDAPGVYTLTGLLPGSYAVCAFQSPYARGGFPSLNTSVCYDDIVSTIDNAQPVTVTAGVTTTGIDLTIGVEGDGGAIGGVVRSPEATPLPGIEVYLYRYATDTGITGIAMTTTSETGDYVFRGLKKASYRIAFRDTLGPYLSEYYAGASRLEEATPIEIDQNLARLDVDANLARGGVITGTIRILDETFPDGAYVSLLAMTGTDSSWLGTPFTYDSGSGIYRLAGVPPGQYKLAFSASINGIPHNFAGYYRNAASLEQAEVITVTPGVTLSDLNANLGEGDFDGVIAGRITSNGQALAGIKVSLSSRNSATIGLIGEALSDADGHYHFGGLTAGTYTLWFSDPAEIYATSYYSNASTSATGSEVWIDQGEQLTNLDAELQLAGAVSGRVVLRNIDAPDNFVVRLWFVTQESPFLAEMSQNGTLDSDGAYRVAALPPGTYRACVYELQLGWVPHICYGNPFGLSYVYGATDISVRAGVTTPNINMFLGDSYPHSAFLPMLAK